jgi:hypothetical protein
MAQGDWVCSHDPTCRTHDDDMSSRGQIAHNMTFMSSEQLNSAWRRPEEGLGREPLAGVRGSDPAYERSVMNEVWPYSVISWPPTNRRSPPALSSNAEASIPSNDMPSSSPPSATMLPPATSAEHSKAPVPPALFQVIVPSVAPLDMVAAPPLDMVAAPQLDMVAAPQR